MVLTAAMTDKPLQAGRLNEMLNTETRLTLSADQPWSGRLLFDHHRHREIIKLPVDYPRINQFPEWFTLPPTVHPEGGPLTLEPARETCLSVAADGTIDPE